MGTIRCSLFWTRCLRCISSARLQDHCMYQGSSCAACSGGNITSPLGWTFWSTVAVAVRVLPMWGEVVRSELPADVQLALEVGEAFVEPERFHVVFNA